MAKAKNPTCLSKAFGIEPKRLSALGVLDVTLAIDTKLFIDPMLLEVSRHSELNTEAVQLYREYFETMIKLLEASNQEGDVAWNSALKRLTSKEIAGTCLGYGAGSIHGSAIGRGLATKILRVASQIVKLGVKDPDLFAALALFESGIGSDRISDLTTKVILPALAKFNLRILNELKLSGKPFDYPKGSYSFLKNPYEPRRVPVVLLPKDILRDLPIATDWDGVAYAAAHNDALREQLNQKIASIWATKTKRDKEKLKEQALKSKAAFNLLLKSINAVKKTPYDSVSDPDGLLLWATNAEIFADKYPIEIRDLPTDTLDDVFKVVMEIVKQFRHLIENCGLCKELYRTDGSPRHESTSQRLFFATSYAYCKSNNIDISPEIDTGNGKIDFKFSHGDRQKVLVEIKLSTNSATVSGYENQLETYKLAQQTTRAIYLVIDVGQMGSKDKRLTAIRNEASKRGNPLSELEFVDGIIRPSASKRKPVTRKKR